MENTPRSNASQDILPQGFAVGVLPPDGVQLTLELWLKILAIDAHNEETFVKQLRKDKIPHPKFCGTMLVDSTHIRRIVHCGRGET